MSILVTTLGDRAQDVYLEWLAATIRNPNTRTAYRRAIEKFSTWCEARLPGADLGQLSAVHIAAYIEDMSRHGLSAGTVKQALSAIKVFCDHLVVRQVLPFNPATSVRAPRVVRRVGKTPVLVDDEARTLIDAIDTSTLWGLRNRALIATMAYTFARISAALSLKVGDYEICGRRGYLKLKEKGGKEIDAPCHHELDEAMEAWLTASGLSDQRNHPLFPAIPGGKTILNQPLNRMTTLVMVNSLAKRAGIKRHISNHTFRATGITAYLRNGGHLETAQYLAGHGSPETTKIYDRRAEAVAVSEVERIRL